ncbi:HNH endonuclease [Pseudomonadota bacterium]|uniref:HNH endonuclease n=1 Tax=Shewanella sp. 6_MG-2023 TaxID=3062660 RepID=UPI0026E15377|nr:HNH endonuclease [Shewanella sp. 6_MG-2023]MDO6620228.1 HNH endonuclease [Shewanella sp. 6_MG-2023]
MSVETAKQYVLDRVLLPAIASNHVAQKVKDVTKSQVPWIESFKKVGDIYQYLLSTTKTRDSSVDQLDAAGLETYESILPSFEKKFKDELGEISQFGDFKLDQEYYARDILSVVRQYDTRSGGIQLHKVDGELKAIAIKVTLKGGKYENEWLIKGTLLKYYMKSIGDTFRESYEDNKSIINSGHIPIYTFVRTKKTDNKFTFKGAFRYLNHFDENDKKWFQLGEINSTHISSLQEINAELNLQAEISSNDLSEKRRKRLSKAPKKPKTRVVRTVIYERNPDVVAEVLEQAKGVCGACFEDAPFVRKSNAKPYLEVHHIVRLADGGDDTVDNAIALCPNCHRKKHYGS